MEPVMDKAVTGTATATQAASQPKTPTLQYDAVALANLTQQHAALQGDVAAKTKEVSNHAANLERTKGELQTAKESLANCEAAIAQVFFVPK